MTLTIIALAVLGYLIGFFLGRTSAVSEYLAELEKLKVETQETQKGLILANDFLRVVREVERDHERQLAEKKNDPDGFGLVWSGRGVLFEIYSRVSKLGGVAK